MKKWTTGVVIAIVAVCFSAVGFAADFNKKDGRGFHRGERPEMSAQQKQDFADFMVKKNQLEVEYLNNEVQAGRMTREVADAHITLMNDRLAKMSKGFVEPSAEQIEARRVYMEKVHNLRIESIKNAVASGSMTQEQADRMLSKMDKNGRDGGHKQGGHKDRGPRGHQGF